MAERVAVTPELRERLKNYTREEVTKWNASHDTKLNPDVVVGLFAHESRDFDPYAKSPTGALGIPQFTEDTAAEYGLSPQDRVNPTKAIPAGIAHFAKGVKAFPDKPLEQIRAYNAGIKGTQDFLAGKPILNKDGSVNKERMEEIKNFPHLVVSKVRALSGSAESEGSVKPVANTQPQETAKPQEVNPAQTAAQQLAELRAKSGTTEDQDTVSSFGQDVMTGARHVGNLTASIGSGMIDTFTQFPAELNARLGYEGQRFGNAIADRMGLPNKAQLEGNGLGPPPHIDPMGAYNFLTLPLGMGSGRVVNAGIGATQAFFQDLDARARADTEAKGEHWDELGFGERATRIVNKLNWDSFDPEMARSLAEGAGLGFLFGGKRPGSGDLSRDIELIRMPATSSKMTVAEKEAYDAALKSSTKSAETNAARDIAEKSNAEARQAYFENLNNAERWNTEAATKNQAARDVYTDQVRRLESPYQEALDRHNAMIDTLEEKTGMPALPKTAGELEKTAYQQQVKGRFMEEIGLPETDPSSVKYQALFGSRELGWSLTATREVPPEVVAQVNEQLGVIAKEAKGQDALASTLKKLSTPLDDPEGIKPVIAKIEARMAELTPSDTRWQKLNLKRTELQSKLVKPTVIDLENRAQAIAKAQRSTLFRDPANANEARLITDAKKALYGTGGEGGLVERALSGEEAAALRDARATSLEYNQKERAADFISKAFGDVGDGARNIRNRLKAKEKVLRKQFGDERYEGLLDLARTFDDLNAGRPPKLPKGELPPKPTELPYAKLPNEPKLADVPAEVVARTLPGYDSSIRRLAGNQVRAFISALNDVVGHTNTERMIKLMAVPTMTAAAYTYGGERGQGAAKYAVAGMTVNLLGTLIANPAARREFKVMAAHLNNATSTEFSKAFARFATAVEIQRLHREEAGATLKDEQPTPVEVQTAIAGKIPPPAIDPQAQTPPPALPIPTRRTGKVAAR